MKKIVLVILAIALFSCTENQRAKNFGGKMTINLPVNTRLKTATWKETNLWYLTEPMPSGYIPQTTEFHEYSGLGIIEGTVIFVERKGGE